MPTEFENLDDIASKWALNFECLSFITLGVQIGQLREQGLSQLGWVGE